MINVQFSHANGFPGRCYSYLFEQMPSCQFSYVEKMGHGDYPLNGDIKNYAHELIIEVKKRFNEPIIGMGHSAGAVVTLLAAAEEPSLFKHVILLDPVLFSKRKRFALRLIKSLGLMDRFTPAGRAEKRRPHFTSRQEATAYFESKTLFKTFHPLCFSDYIEHGLHETEDGLALSISPDIEADVFRNVLLKAPKSLKKVSGTVIYGEDSDLFQKVDREYWLHNFPHMELIPFAGGHLFPFEKPDQTATLLNDIITSMNELK